MVFSSILFLCIFMPIVIGCYVICPKSLRNGWLLVASLFFYAWGEPVYLGIMLFSTVFDYINGRLIEHFEAKNQGYRKVVLVVSIVGNLGILCFFKYTNFFVSIITGNNKDVLDLALPIGISFYTFQTMSYTIDVYRKQVKAQHNFIDFAMYVSMFPQLIAGPIVRYCSIEKEMNNRELDPQRMGKGLYRFILGLGKKVLLANQIGALWTEISGYATYSVADAWLGALAFTFQIYFDFSGYSDMAIGLGEIFGFTFPENFDHPYESKSITEFWRRWHMTLGTWFREYVYIPLGGNRQGMKRQVFNLLVVWGLTGLWHGAAFNFVLWGLYFFLLLWIEKVWLLKKLTFLRDWAARVYAMFFVVIGWAIFANDSMPMLGRYLKAMFGFGEGLASRHSAYLVLNYLPMFLVLAIGATTLPKKICDKIYDFTKSKIGFLAKRESIIKRVCKGFLSVLVVVLSFAFLVSGSYNPFLYFRF